MKTTPYVYTVKCQTKGSDKEKDPLYKAATKFWQNMNFYILMVIIIWRNNVLWTLLPHRH